MTYKIIKGGLVNLDRARVGQVVKVYRADHYERCLVLLFRRLWALPFQGTEDIGSNRSGQNGQVIIL